MRTEALTEHAIETRIRAIRSAVRSNTLFARRQSLAGAAAVAAIPVVALLGAWAAAGLALLALAAFSAASFRPELVGVSVALSLPAGERLQVLDAQVAPLEAVVGGAAIGYLLRLATGPKPIAVRAADWTFVAFVAFVALSTLGPVDDSSRARELLFWAALAVVFHAVHVNLIDRRARLLTFGALAIAVVVESLVALFEYGDRWSERYSELSGAIVYPLPQATLGHPNGLAQFLVFATLSVLAFALVERGWLGRSAFVVVALGSLALVVTFSRASWIAFALGVSLYVFERKTRFPAVAASGLALVVGAALAVLDEGAIGARVSSLFRAQTGDIYDFRLELVERAAGVVADHPVTGSGRFEEVGIYAGRPDLATHPHNLFLGIAVFFGIPAALAFAGIVFLALRAAWRSGRTAVGGDRLAALGLIAVLVALLVNGLFEYPLWNVSLASLVVLVLAVAVASEPSRPPSEDATTPG